MILFAYFNTFVSMLVNDLVDKRSHQKKIVFILDPIPIVNTILFICSMYIIIEIKKRQTWQESSVKWLITIAGIVPIALTFYFIQFQTKLSIC